MPGHSHHPPGYGFRGPGPGPTLRGSMLLRSPQAGQAPGTTFGLPVGPMASAGPWPSLMLWVAVAVLVAGGLLLVGGSMVGPGIKRRVV